MLERFQSWGSEKKIGKEERKTLVEDVVLLGGGKVSHRAGKLVSSTPLLTDGVSGQQWRVPTSRTDSVS